MKSNMVTTSQPEPTVAGSSFSAHKAGAGNAVPRHLDGPGVEVQPGDLHAKRDRRLCKLALRAARIEQP